MSTVRILVPIKGGKAAKTRLKPALSSGEHAQWVQQTYRHTLTVLAQVVSPAQIHVMSADSDVLNYANTHQMNTLPEPVAQHFGLKVRAGVETLLTHKQGPLAVLMTDLPHISQNALANFFSHTDRYEALIAPDRHLAGTNLAFVKNPEPADFHFGNADSARRHQVAWQEKNLSYLSLYMPELALFI